MKKTHESEINTASVRKLLLDSFGDEELTLFCFDYFRPVHDSFASGMRRLLKIQLLIDYCDRYGKFDELFEHIKTINPYQYEKYISSILTKTVSFQKQKSDIAIEMYDVIDLSIGGDFSALSEEQLGVVVGAFRGALASVLGVSQDEIVVLKISHGSLKLKLRIPTEAATQLKLDYGENNEYIGELGIQSVTQVINISDSYARLIEVIKSRYNLSDEDALKVVDSFLLEISDRLDKGDSLAFVRSKDDGTVDLTVLNLEKEV